MKFSKIYRLIHIIVVLYIIAAFSWWAILLHKKNVEIHQLGQLLVELDDSFDRSVIDKKYEVGQKMIIGEGLVFGLSILLGLIIISRAFWSEINLNRRLNDFLLSVTHELKTPIAALKLSTQTLRKKNLNPEKQVLLLDTSLEECLRLEDQVNNILTAAQIESSYTFNLEKNELISLLKSRISRFEKIYPQRPLKLSYDQEKILINIDLEAFTKAIDNLIHNAIKYSEKIIEIEVLETGQKVVLKFIDQGKGIKESEKAKVMDKFYRSENEDTRETTGTGLGLWITNRVITAHKGQIKILNNQPQGCIIEINLPIV